MIPGDREPDDLCPSCGVPQPIARRGAACSHCGYEFAAGDRDAFHAGYLTPFGYGLCGLIAGGHLGAGIALTNPDATLDDPRLVLFPLVMGIVCSLLAWWVGRRLDWRMRPGYESVLFGVMAAALSVFVLGLWGVRSADTLLATALVVFVVTAPLLRRMMYRRR